jgi:hypothetical protein
MNGLKIRCVLIGQGGFSNSAISTDCLVIEVTLNRQFSSQSEAVLVLSRSTVGRQSVITVFTAVYPLRFLYRIKKLVISLALVLEL